MQRPSAAAAAVLVLLMAERFWGLRSQSFVVLDGRHSYCKLSFSIFYLNGVTLVNILKILVCRVSNRKVTHDDSLTDIFGVIVQTNTFPFSSVLS